MKKIFTLLVAFTATTSAFAQGFSSISVEGALTGVSIRGGANELQVVVSENTDLNNIVINATPETGAEIDGALPKVFTENVAQNIPLKKTDGSGSRTWAFTIRKLRPATLPFSKTVANSDGDKVSDWTTSTLGWSYAGIDIGQAAVIRYGTKTPTFVVGFAESPKNVTYNLYTVSKNFPEGNIFDVEASADGITWRTLHSYVGADALTTTNPSNYSHDLQSTDRFIRWTYTERSSVNLNLNNIVVSQADNSPAGIRPAAAAPAFYQSAAGEITFTEPVAKAEVYNLLGGKTVVYNNPQGTISIADGVKGVALVRVALKDGSTITKKVVK